MVRRTLILVFAFLLAYLFSIDEWNGDVWSVGEQSSVVSFAFLPLSATVHRGIGAKNAQKENSVSCSAVQHNTWIIAVDDLARDTTQDNETLVFPPSLLVPVPVWCPIGLTVEVAPATPLEARGPPLVCFSFPTAALRAPPFS